MPRGCWIDLYETPDLSGERRRFFGPGKLDSVVWRQFGDADVVSLHVGPDASVSLVGQDGSEKRLAPNSDSRRLPVTAIETLAIKHAPESADDQTPRDRSVSGVPPDADQPRIDGDDEALG